MDKELQLEKFDRHKWPTNGYIDRSTASLGRKMAEGRLLYCTLDMTYFCICLLQSRPMAGFGAFLTHVFFLFTTGRRKELIEDF